MTWDPPAANRSTGNIVYYKLQYVDADKSDSEATEIKFNDTSIVLDELKRWTTYRIWVLAGTSVGDGPSSYPITVRTHEDGTLPIIFYLLVLLRSKKRILTIAIKSYSGHFL